MEKQDGRPPALSEIKFSAREIAILELLFRGFTNKAINDKLQSTSVSTYLNRIYNKMYLPDWADSGRSPRVMAAGIWSKIRTQYVS